MGRTTNRSKTEAGIAYIPTAVTWDIPADDLQYEINVPISNMRDDLNFEVAGLAVDPVILDIKSGGYVLGITVSTGEVGPFDLVVITPGGSTNENLQLGLADNHLSRIAVGASYKVNGDDTINLYTESLLFPGYHTFTDSFATDASQALVAGKLYGPFFTIKRRQIVKSIAVAPTSAPGGNLVVGIYRVVNGIVTEKVGQSDPTTPFTLAATGTQRLTFSTPLVLDPGDYVQVVLCDTVAGMYMELYSRSKPRAGFGATISATGYLNAVIYTMAYTANLPDPFPVGYSTQAISYTPLILFET